MKTIIPFPENPELAARVEKIMCGFVHIREAMYALGETAAEARRTLEAASARLPRSFESVDAMHWTPPADGQEVPPCLA